MNAKPKTSLLFLILLAGLPVFAQRDYYYYQGEKIKLTLDKSKLKVILSDDYSGTPVTSPFIKSFDQDYYRRGGG